MRRTAFLTAVAITLPMAASFAQPPPPPEDRARTYERDRRPYDPYDRYSRDDPYYRDGRYYRDPVQYDYDVRWNRERYDRWDRSRYARDFRGRWMVLARGIPARTGRQFINLNGGRLGTLRIEAVRGEPVILKIAIEYWDRTGQALEYREALPAGTGEVFDLLGRDRRINRIIIYTDPYSRGAYSVYGA